MGQAKRKSREGHLPLSRVEREFRQQCLHEASHAVAAIMQGVRCYQVLVWNPQRGKIGSKPYMDWVCSR